MSEELLRPQARVLLRHDAQTVQTIVRAIDGHLDLDDLATVSANRLELSDTGLMWLRLTLPVSLADYSISRFDGTLLLIDIHEGGMLGANMVQLADVGRTKPVVVASSDRG